MSVTMLKKLFFVLFMLSAIGCTTYGAPANVDDDDASGLLLSLSPSMTFCYYTNYIILMSFELLLCLSYAT